MCDVKMKYINTDAQGVNRNYCRTWSRIV